MKAVQMIEPGGPEVLHLAEIAEPQIRSPGQVKVRLHAAGVNPVDAKLRSRGVFYPDALPAVLGCDGAGVVVETGDAVSCLQPGDEVWFCHGGLGAAQGNYAEYTVVEEGVARRKPSSLSFEEAAAAPLVLITAWEALNDRARLRAGQTVLIHGGAGGVGHVAIQLARLIGARVCATVGSARKAEFVRALGAEKAILHGETDFVVAINEWTDARGVDAALDTVGGDVFRRTLEAVAYCGDVVTLLEPGSEVVWKEARTRNLRVGFELMLTPMLRDLPEALAYHGQILDLCRERFEAGTLSIHVGARFPLALAREAHALVEAGHMQGKAVLTID